MTRIVRFQALALCLLILLPAQNLSAHPRSYIPEVLVGTLTAGIIVLCGILGWKAMSNAHSERQQQLALEHDEQEKRVLDNVAAINPQVQFGTLIELIHSNESVDTIAAFCNKQNLHIDNLATMIAQAKNNAHGAYARLQSHAESWRNNGEYSQYYQRALTLLEQKAHELVTLDHLYDYVQGHRDYLNLYQTYYTIDAHSYVFTKDPFDLIHAVQALDADVKSLQQAINRVSCKELYVFDSSCLLMLNKATQKVALLKQNRDTFINSREYSEQLCHKLFAEQKEKELALQRELVAAQKQQAQAMLERVRLEEKNYQRHITVLQQRIHDLHCYLHKQQSIITSLEREIAALKRLHGRDVYQADELLRELHQLQMKIQELERQFPAELLPAAAW